MKSTVGKILVFSIIVLFALPPSIGLCAQIQMNKTKLEPPTGMKVYEVRLEQLDSGVVNKIALQQGLSQSGTQGTPRGNVALFADKSTKANRLLVNQSSGHMSLVPNIEKLAKMQPRLLQQGAAFNQAVNHANSLKLAPSDVSQFRPSKLLTLSSAELGKGGQATGPVKNILQTVQFSRTINNKAVMGAGSQLHVDLGDNGNLEGFGKSVNKLAESKLAPSFKNDAEVYGEIEKNIAQQFPGNAVAKVNTPRLVYFGESGKFVQPAYQFDVEVSGPNQVGKVYYNGVVSALKNAPEAIRKMRSREMPNQAKAEMEHVQVALADDDPTVCRYVVRNDHYAWAEDATDFKNGLIAGHPASFPAITFLDYYWDYPYIWTTSANSFANKCHISLMEGHGANWLFTTVGNCCDVVNLNAGTQPGYGNKAGDSMRLLVLKGCSIVPSPQDRTNWPDPWWRIFKGLQTAVGFRTTMYINDDISDNFGFALARGVRIVDAWFSATNSSTSYGWNRFWGSEVTGYGTVVMIPGYYNATIYNTGRAPDATAVGLSIFWQH